MHAQYSMTVSTFRGAPRAPRGDTTNRPVRTARYFTSRATKMSVRLPKLFFQGLPRRFFRSAKFIESTSRSSRTPRHAPPPRLSSATARTRHPASSTTAPIIDFLERRRPLLKIVSSYIRIEKKLCRDQPLVERIDQILQYKKPSPVFGIQPSLRI